MLNKENVLVVTKKSLTDAADSIRAKTGDSDLIKVEDLDTEIDSIKTGITPTGTIQITQNGQGIDVTNYAAADVAVENSYTQADEGKVVDNGELVSQTSKNINANGTVDTTKNNEVVVSVPNTYVAADEGKVVDNGSLVAQTAKPDTITQNNTYDTTKYNSVTVNVSGANNKEADLIKGTLSGAYTNSDFTGVKGVRARGFDGFEDLTSLSLPNCTTIGDYGISNCRLLANVDLPDVTQIGSGGLQSLGQWLSSGTGVVFNLPKLVNVGQDGFYNTQLKAISLPACEYISFGAFRALRGSDIEVDLSKPTHGTGGSTQHIPDSCFKSSSIKSLILRSLDNIWPLNHTNAFQSTQIASGTGYIYVPAALKSTYEAATNWITYAAQFRALEDYTIDGTTTGALDPSKI